VSGWIVDDPENPVGAIIGLARYDLFDQVIKGCNVILDFTAADDSSVVYVEGGDIGPSATREVLMLNPHGMTRGSSAWHACGDGLEGWSFIRKNDNSSSFRARPSRCRAYKSSTRAALVQNPDRVGIPNCGDTKAEWHLHATSATGYCRRPTHFPVEKSAKIYSDCMRGPGTHGGSPHQPRALHATQHIILTIRFCDP
jgi:hypothetical protein